MQAVQTVHASEADFSRAAKAVLRFAQTLEQEHVRKYDAYSLCKKMLRHCLGGEDWSDAGMTRYEAFIDELAGVLGI